MHGETDETQEDLYPNRHISHPGEPVDGLQRKNIVGPGRITPEPPEPWSVLFGGDDGEKIFDLILDRNSQVYATGTFGSNEQSDNDILLVEYSLAGELYPSFGNRWRGE